MAIGFAALGTKATSGTTALSIAYPASVGAGNLVIASRVVWLSTATTANEAGWTPGPELAGGTGSTADNHATKVRLDYKEAVGGETGSVIFDQSGSAFGGAGIMCRFTKAAGTTWDVLAVTGDDATHGANRSVTSSGTVSLAPGDMVVALAAVDTDVSTTISPSTMTATGITFGACNRQTSGLGSASDVHGNVELFQSAVTAGSGTQALTLAFTTATLQCGPVAFLRLREVAAPKAPPPYQPVRRMLPYLVR
jgi:hypothetical protein